MKVLVVGKPKSGTSIIAGRIKAGLDAHFNVNSQLLFEPKINDGIPEIKDYSVTKILYSQNRRHLSSFEMAEEVGQLFDKKVIIYRDPRDILVSDTLYKWFQGHKPKEDFFQKALDLVLEKEKDPSSVNLYQISSINIHCGIASSLEAYAAVLKDEYDQFADDIFKLQDRNWCLVKYEDIILDSVQELNQYLEFEIAKDISNISNQKKAFSRTARTKSYGNWKNWFTQDDINFFKPIFEKSLQTLGYGTDDWNINLNQNIDPKTSSEYMINLFQNN